MGPIWETLDISPTDDARAIRVAYAQRLKRINIDTDPHAFIALRSAYEHAIGNTASAPWIAPMDAGIDNPAKAELPAAERRAIYMLLASSESNAAIAPRLTELTEKFVAHRHTHSLSQVAEIENWLAEILANNLPRAAGMLTPAVENFGWQERATGYDCPETVSFAVQAYEDYNYLADLQRINPAYQVAWAALTESEIDLTTVHRGCMTTMLGIVQYQRPGLIDHIDLQRFQEWVEYLDQARTAEIRTSMLDPLRESENQGTIRPVIDTLINLCIFIIGASLFVRAFFILMNFQQDTGDRILAFIVMTMIGATLVALAKDRQQNLRRRVGAREHRG